MIKVLSLLQLTKKDIKLIEYVLNKGADVNMKISDYTPLFMAREMENFDIIKCLIGKGANISVEDGDDYY